LNAAQYLLTKSSLITGAAGAHLTSALQLGTGLVVNDGVDMEVDFMTLDAEIDDTVVDAEVSDEAVSVELAETEIIVEVEEW